MKKVLAKDDMNIIDYQGHPVQQKYQYNIFCIFKIYSNFSKIYLPVYMAMV